MTRDELLQQLDAMIQANPERPFVQCALSALVGAILTGTEDELAESIIEYADSAVIRIQAGLL